MTIYYKDKTLPNRFKECRIASNLTQAELCKLLGFTGNKYTVYMYEANKRLPNIKTMIKMHKIFDVSLNYLLCLDDFKNHYDYIVNQLGMSEKMIQLYMELTCDYKLIKRINKYIHNHYKVYSDEIENKR